MATYIDTNCVFAKLSTFSNPKYEYPKYIPINGTKAIEYSILANIAYAKRTMRNKLLIICIEKFVSNIYTYNTAKTKVTDLKVKQSLLELYESVCCSTIFYLLSLNATITLNNR